MTPPLKRVAAIIGGGVIGGGWAARFLLSGWDVKLYDLAPDAERKIGEVLANARRSLPSLSDLAPVAEGKLTFVRNIQDAVCDANWIQESVPERLDIKHRVFKEIQNHALPNALIGSSTSGFKPSQLGQYSNCPAQIFVAHPFNPVYLLPLVELVGQIDSVQKARDILSDIGMKPLIIRKEIDAHIADRLLEAVWREALWLINDGVASTEEIDDAIRFGFGLRWAQMGLFETYRIAGGEAGMAHFIEQFGPCLQWPWSKLTDVPELTDELVKTIADQSDQQSGSYSIRDLERIRDDNLVVMMRALKARNWGAGQLLAEQDEVIKTSKDHDFSKPIISIDRVIPIDWTDYNGHMNESRYGQVFSDAADMIMDLIGADKAYIDAGKSYFTVDTHTKFIDETQHGEQINVTTRILFGEGKKLRLLHEMKSIDGRDLASCVQLLIHVSLETRRSCLPEHHIIDRLNSILDAQSVLPLPNLEEKT